MKNRKQLKTLSLRFLKGPFILILDSSTEMARNKVNKLLVSTN
jgi:hypothetical protein